MGKWLIIGRNGLVSNQSPRRKVKWFSVTSNALVLGQMVSYKPKWFSVTTVGLRRNRQKYKREIGKSSLK